MFQKDVAQNPSQAGEEKIVQSHRERIPSSKFEKLWNIDDLDFGLQKNKGVKIRDDTPTINYQPPSPQDV